MHFPSEKAAETWRYRRSQKRTEEDPEGSFSSSGSRTDEGSAVGGGLVALGGEAGNMSPITGDPWLFSRFELCDVDTVKGRAVSCLMSPSDGARHCTATSKFGAERHFFRVFGPSLRD